MIYLNGTHNSERKIVNTLDEDLIFIRVIPKSMTNEGYKKMKTTTEQVCEKDNKIVSRLDSRSDDIRTQFEKGVLVANGYQEVDTGKSIKKIKVYTRLDNEECIQKVRDEKGIDLNKIVENAKDKTLAMQYSVNVIRGIHNKEQA